MVHEIFLSFIDYQHVTISIENMSQTSSGAIASGVYGSGVFPVSLLLFLFTNGVIAYEMVIVLTIHLFDRFGIIGIHLQRS